MPELKFKSTEDLQVSKKIIDQVIGQEEGVEIIKKAGEQRRHVFLIGEPGTGKSMMGLALAELLPKEKLVDILSFPNPNDENTPLIRVVPAGQGRDLVARSRMESAGTFKNQYVFMIIFALAAGILPYYWWSKGKISDVIYAAFLISGMVFMFGLLITLNLGRRMENKGKIPRLIVDNYGQKTASFYDATGAHAGALLGDVLHDPFQTFSSILKINKVKDNKIESVQLNHEIDPIFDKYKNKILKKEQNNYEAIFLPKDELSVLGETHGSVSPVEVLSCNRYDYDDKMIKLTTSENRELIVTPKHQIAIFKNGKIEYVEVKFIKEGDVVIAKSEDTIIDEQDIINTYDAPQIVQSNLYSNYLDIKVKNPSWGYKRIAKSLGLEHHKTRWWHAKKHIPVPIQTVNLLKSRGLLPLKLDNPKLPLIAKVLGATFGDGGIFRNLNGIFLSSSEKEAIEGFGKDLETIFNLKKDENSRIIEGGVYGHSWCFQNTNRNAIRFFLALGAPHGNKSLSELKVPNWIKLSKIFEDEFYGSFIGGELGTPIIHKHGNFLTTLEVGITGTPNFEANRIKFLKELADYLKRNGVNTTSIYKGKSKTEGSLVFRLLIGKKIDNVIQFLMNVKINYCKYKIDRLYRALGQWSMLKKNKYNELIKRGYGAEHAMKVLNLTPNSLYLLLNHFGQKEAVA